MEINIRKDCIMRQEETMMSKNSGKNNDDAYSVFAYAVVIVFGLFYFAGKAIFEGVRDKEWDKVIGGLFILAIQIAIIIWLFG